MYCSKSCYDTALNAYHRTECGMILFYDPLNDTAEANALRTFLLGTEQGKQLPMLMATMQPRDIFKKTVYSSDKVFVNDYTATLKIFSAWYAGEELLNQIERMLPRALAAVLALRNLSFFPESNRTPVRPRCRKSATIFFLSILLLVF